MSVSEGQSLRGRRIPDQASLPAPSYRSQPPSYHTGLDQATNVPDELSIRSEPVEVPTRRPKVFLYYKVFRPDGVIPCKEPVNPRNPYLARIEAVHITPPQTVASLIRCIVKKEEREFGSVPLKSDPLNTELFEAPSSLAPMKQEQHLAIMNGSGPGSDPRKPLALVITEYALDKTICAIHDCRGNSEIDSRWLNFTRGDVLHSDRILLRDVAFGQSAHANKYDVYRAHDSSGRVGYVSPTFFK